MTRASDPMPESAQPAAPASPQPAAADRVEVERTGKIPPAARDALRASSRGDRALRKHGLEIAQPELELTERERELVDAISEHGFLNRAADALGISGRTAARMVQRSPSVAAAIARARPRAALSLEGTAWGVADGSVPAEVVELVDGDGRVVWTRRTYRRDARLIELLLRQHGGAAWKESKTAAPTTSIKRILIEGLEIGAADQPRTVEAEPLDSPGEGE